MLAESSSRCAESMALGSDVVEPDVAESALLTDATSVVSPLDDFDSEYFGTTTSADVSAAVGAMSGGARSEFFAHHAPHINPTRATAAIDPHMTPAIGNDFGAVPHQMHFPFFRG